MNEKVIVRAKVNDGSFQDFVVDTGAENTVLSRPTAQRLRHADYLHAPAPALAMWVCGLQPARINTLELGTLKLRNVPCLIKDPPLRDIPDARSRSALAAGARFLDDHRLPAPRRSPSASICLSSGDFEVATCVCIAWRPCAGTVDGTHAELRGRHGRRVISISKATASAIASREPARKVQLKVTVRPAGTAMRSCCLG